MLAGSVADRQGYGPGSLCFYARTGVMCFLAYQLELSCQFSHSAVTERTVGHSAAGVVGLPMFKLKKVF